MVSYFLLKFVYDNVDGYTYMSGVSNVDNNKLRVNEKGRDSTCCYLSCITGSQVHHAVE